MKNMSPTGWIFLYLLLVACQFSGFLVEANIVVYTTNGTAEAIVVDDPIVAFKFLGGKPLIIKYEWT